MNKPVVLITGALTGIGRAAAIAFAKDGTRLVVSGRRETEGKALEAELHRLGAEASFIQAGASVYVGSKHAVEGITKSVALEIAKSGIRVNGVAPGPTDTGMLTRFTGTPEKKKALMTGVPLGRLGLSEDIAKAIVFLASDEASFITGHILNIDGGKTAG